MKCLIAIVVYLFSYFPHITASDLTLPLPGNPVGLSKPFDPILMRGVKIEVNRPLSLDFMVDVGQHQLNDQQVAETINQLVKYFLTALTIPEDEWWVNLSPYEKDRIITPAFNDTLMGIEMLALDYKLKQLSASLLDPAHPLGAKFWQKVYAQTAKEYGHTDLPVQTFHKIWIVADTADVYEQTDQGQLINAQSAANAVEAYVVNAHLKVMMESDYLALERNKPEVASYNQQDLKQHNTSSTRPLGFRHEEQSNNVLPSSISISTNIYKEIILPEIEKEINTGEHFATLRQMFYSMILAAWYKKTLKASLISAGYQDKSKTANLHDPAITINSEQIYQWYLTAFKKGVVNKIEDAPMPRKYFSGGFHPNPSAVLRVIKDKSQIAELGKESNLAMASITLALSTDAAMLPAQEFTVLRNVKRIEMGGANVRFAYEDFAPKDVKYENEKLVIKGPQNRVVVDKISKNDFVAHVGPLIILHRLHSQFSRTVLVYWLNQQGIIQEIPSNIIRPYTSQMLSVEVFNEIVKCEFNSEGNIALKVRNKSGKNLLGLKEQLSDAGYLDVQGLIAWLSTPEASLDRAMVSELRFTSGLTERRIALELFDEGDDVLRRGARMIFETVLNHSDKDVTILLPADKQMLTQLGDIFVRFMKAKKESGDVALGNFLSRLRIAPAGFIIQDRPENNQPLSSQSYAAILTNHWIVPLREFGLKEQQVFYIDTSNQEMNQEVLRYQQWLKQHVVNLAFSHVGANGEAFLNEPIVQVWWADLDEGLSLERKRTWQGSNEFIMTAVSADHLIDSAIKRVLEIRYQMLQQEQPDSLLLKEPITFYIPGLRVRGKPYEDHLLSMVRNRGVQENMVRFIDSDEVDQGVSRILPTAGYLDQELMRELIVLRPRQLFDIERIVILSVNPSSSLKDVLSGENDDDHQPLSILRRHQRARLLGLKELSSFLRTSQEQALIYLPNGHGTLAPYVPDALVQQELPLKSGSEDNPAMNAGLKGGIDLNVNQMQMNISHQKGVDISFKIHQDLLSAMQDDGFQGFSFNLERVVPYQIRVTTP